MQASLTNEKWDLVIFDESDSIAGGLDDLYNNFVSTGAAGRILALDSLGQSVLAGAAKKEIKLQQIVDEKGNEDRFLTKYIEFESSPEELKLNREINRFQKQLKEMEKAGNSIASTIVKRSLSSTRALEKSLIRFQSNWQPVRNRLAHSQVVDTNFLENFFVQEKYLFGAGEDKLDGELEFKQRARRTLFSEHAKATYVYRHIQRGEKPEEIAIRTGQTLDEITEYINLYEDVEVFYEQKSKLFVQLFAGIERLLEMVDELSTDTKGQTFTDYLVEIIKEQRCNHICVITYYEDTAQYLNTLLESVSVESRLVTSAVSPEDKENILVDYSAKGGILIFSIAALQGIELKADLCINYDEALVKEIEQYMHMVWIRSREVRTTFQMLAFKNKSADSINLPIGISSVNPHHF